MNIVITGANRGIGLEIAKIFAERGDTVLALCRSSSDELEAIGATVHSGIDVAKDEGIKSAQQALGQTAVDVLINNAGIFRNETLDEFDVESIRAQFEVNALAPIRLVQALKGRLTKGGKIGLITSRMGSIEDNGSGAYYGYRMSKAALNAGGKSLAIDLEASGVALAILHPGFVQTQMTNYSGDVTASEAASGLVARLDELTLDTTGSFWHAQGQRLPW